MRIGIIAEGTTDQAIITNILMGLGFEYADIIFIRPDLTTDETDKNYENEATIGTWQGVKNACISRDEFEQFYAIADNRYIIIQLDSAEADQPDFNVKRPQKSRNENYATELRQLIIEKVNEWLNFQYTEKLLYAICIEEMEAWVLTIYQDVETTKSADPKTRLRNELSRKKIDKKGCRDDKDYAEKYSKDFNRKKKLALYSSRNQSLIDFITSVQQAIDKIDQEEQENTGE